MDICHCCLSMELHVKTLDESGIHNFNLITNLNIECTPERPLCLCDECITSLNYCIEFRDKCIASDVTLKEILPPRDKLKLFDIQDKLAVEVVKEELDEFNDDFIKSKHANSCDDNDAYIMSAQGNENENDEVIYKENDGNFDDEPNFLIEEIKYEVPAGDDENDTQIRDNQKHPEKMAIKSQRKTNRKPKTSKKKPEVKEIITEDSEETIHCGLCPKIYDGKEDLIKHIEKVHKSSKICSLCQLSCVGYPHLLAHRMEHLPQKQKGCLLCKNKHIVTQTTMEFHYMNVHNLGEKNEKFLCKICSKSYESPEKLRKHMQRVHTEYKFICDYCSKRFRRKVEVKIHLASHKEEKQYKCDQCDYKSKYPAGLHIHITRRHIKDKAVCKPCGRVFRNKKLMEEHRLKCEHTVNHMVCPICGLTVNKLRRHLQTHSDVHKFKCEKCPATYKTKPAYVVHMNKHDGVKKQQCQNCMKRFYSRSSLIKHLRVHTGEKPYVCDICSKGFTSNHNLKVHMKVHGFINLIVKRNKDPEEVNE